MPDELSEALPSVTKFEPPIKARSADGMIHQFPAGTDPSVVDKAMKSYASEHADKSTVMGEVGTGMMDPIEGGGQFIANLLPARAERVLNEANNWLAERSGGLMRKLPEGGKNEQMQQRETEIQETRGQNKDIDWSRLAGNVLSPINYIGTGLVGGAGKLANAGRAITGGMTAGAITPATGKDYTQEKLSQIGLGGVLGAGFGAAGAGVSKGVEKLGEYVARQNPEALENVAVQKVLKRIGQDEKTGGPSASDAIDLINAAKKPVTLADITGANTRGLAGNVSRPPGEAKNVTTNFLNQRDEQAAQRLSQDIEQHVFGGQTMHQATEALLQSRSAAARPAYDAAHGLKNIWSPRLGEFLDDPTVKAGLSRGYEIERLQSLAEGRPLTATQMGVDVGVDGSMKLVSTPNMRVLDMAKQGLDALIADERNDITGRLSAKGVALDKMRRAFVDTIDNLDTSGAYKKARESWAGYSQSLDAIKLGRTVFQQSPEENAAAIGKLSPANREFYRLGLADMLKERLAKTGLSGDESKSLLKNAWMRDQLRPVFKSSSDYDKFIDAVTSEHKMFGTKASVLGGSQTAERMAEDNADPTLAIGGRLATALAHGQTLSGALFSTAKETWKFYKDLGLKPNPELNEKIAQILFTTNFPKDSSLARKLTGNASSALTNPLAGAADVASAASVGAAPAIVPDVVKH